MRPFLSFKRQEGAFCDFGLLNDVLGKIEPPIVPLKFQDGSLGLIKKSEKIFFTGSLTGSKPEIRRFLQPTGQV